MVVSFFCIDILRILFQEIFFIDSMENVDLKSVTKDIKFQEKPILKKE